MAYLLLFKSSLTRINALLWNIKLTGLLVDNVVYKYVFSNEIILKVLKRIYSATWVSYEVLGTFYEYFEIFVFQIN